MATIVVFAPHPDDEVIGCGGRICAHVAKGDTVVVVFMTNGEAGDLTMPAATLGKLRQSEARLAAKALGVSSLHWLGLPDGAVTYSPSTTLAIVKLLRTLQPTTVYSPHQHDAHPDHQATYQLLKTALDQAAAQAIPVDHTKPWRVGTWLTYEVWTPLTTPTTCLTIDPYLSQKTTAMKAYASQLKNVAYDQAMLGLATYRGVMHGVSSYAECFGVERIALE